MEKKSDKQQRGHQQRQLRVDEKRWNRWGRVCRRVGTTRSAIMRELMDAWCKKNG